MRNVIFAINLTLDGCCDHTKGMVPDEEVYAYYTQLLRDTGTLVYGRKTYQLMVPYWPDIAKNQSGTKEANEYALAFGAVEKIVVFSRSLEKAEGENTKIVSTNLRDEILQLKQETGKDILVGGVDIPSQLMALNLIDEYRFMVQPIMVGEGRRLLEGLNLPGRLKLKLVETKVFKLGWVALRYVKS